MMNGLQTHPRLRPWCLVALLAALTVGCQDAPASPLAHGASTPDELAASALQAVANGDEEQLGRLMITREEYETLLWPVLPDRDQMPFDFAWSITGPRSRKARRNVLSEYRGVPLELVRVELGDEVETYDEFALYRRSRMIVRRTDTGAEGVLPLMDTLVEMQGAWKFMNFVDALRTVDVPPP